MGPFFLCDECADGHDMEYDTSRLMYQIVIYRVTHYEPPENFACDE